MDPRCCRVTLEGLCRTPSLCRWRIVRTYLLGPLPLHLQLRHTPTFALGGWIMGVLRKCVTSAVCDCLPISGGPIYRRESDRGPSGILAGHLNVGNPRTDGQDAPVILDRLTNL